MMDFSRNTFFRYGVLILGIGAVGLVTFFLLRINFLFRTETEVFSTAIMETSYRWGSPARTDVTDLENSTASFWIEYTRPKPLAIPFTIVSAEVPRRLMSYPTWSYFDTDSDSHADVRVRSGQHFQRIYVLEDHDGVWVEPPKQDLESLENWVHWAMFGDHSRPFYDSHGAKEELISLINKAIADAGSEETRRILARCAKDLKEPSTASSEWAELKFLEGVRSEVETALQAEMKGR